MTFRSTIAGAAMLAAHPTMAQEHRFEADATAAARTRLDRWSHRVDKFQV
jgi:hypothetical protein